MTTSAPRINGLSLVLSGIVFLWLMFVVDIFLRTQDVHLANTLGLTPRSQHGLWGILGSHILHSDFPHLIANSFGLLILGLVSAWYSCRLTVWAVIYSAVCAGALTWVIASPDSGVHIGASGIIFGLVGFLLVNGIVRRSWAAFILALLVGGIFYSVLPGVLPTEEARMNHISWQMHLGGFLGGILASWKLRHEKPT